MLDVLLYVAGAGVVSQVALVVHKVGEHVRGCLR